MRTRPGLFHTTKAALRDLSTLFIIDFTVVTIFVTILYAITR